MNKEIEDMLFAAQEQTLRTNAIKAKINKQPVSPKCRLCETVMHLVAPSWCRNSTKEDMTMLPEDVQWKLCKKHELESSDRWYEAFTLLKLWGMMMLTCTGTPYYADRQDSGTQQAIYFPS